MRASPRPFYRSTQALLRTRKPSRPTQPLLPPIHLYRRILREHRNLPALQRSLGDEYVKNEFRLHRSTENPLHIVGFLASWQDYLRMISKGDWMEETLSTEVLERLSPEQVTQLYELMKETQLVRDGKSGEIEGDESHEKH
ncbi:ACN9 (YDR511W) [Zygosaccharomyces parabailii]|nr:ACN9 (YDR511W) [Zygosaccharomyces parabailii]CDH09807.1 related to Acetate non-utilizing protein 9,mitochondrial [Zygosaccharomyces bailii ISA1307]